MMLPRLEESCAIFHVDSLRILAVMTARPAMEHRALGDGVPNIVDQSTVVPYYCYVASQFRSPAFSRKFFKFFEGLWFVQHEACWREAEGASVLLGGAEVNTL